MISDHDLQIAKQYFEELIGCAVGCGCWEPGWDADASVREFAREGFSWLSAETNPADVLVSLERLDGLAPEELAKACRFLEIHFDDVAQFRAFWAPSIAVLRAALAGGDQ